MIDREMLIDALGRAVSYAVKNRKTENQTTLIAIADMADYLIANDAYSYADHIIIPPLTDKDLQELKDKLAGNGQIMIFPDCEPSVEVIPRWIPVTERLPEIDQPCLCYKETHGRAEYKLGTYFGGMFSGNCAAFKSMSHYGLIGVTHWMPLPQPPQEVQK